MRPKHMLLVTAMAALPLLLAFLLIGTGGLTAPSPSSPTVPPGMGTVHVSLGLSGGGAGVRADQCGALHSYRTYPARGAIDFTGTITPVAAWSVTVKLKACYANQFQSAGDTQAALGSNGSFSGSFPIPIGGYYYARAEARRNGQLAARSQKLYFEVR